MKKITVNNEGKRIKKSSYQVCDSRVLKKREKILVSLNETS